VSSTGDITYGGPYPVTEFSVSGTEPLEFCGGTFRCVVSNLCNKLSPCKKWHQTSSLLPYRHIDVMRYRMLHFLG
jgi:hypothetical protein